MPRLIRERLPDAKIIIVLRDPVDQAYSHYVADVRFGWQGMPFLKTLQADAHQAQKGMGISHLYLEGNTANRSRATSRPSVRMRSRCSCPNDLRQDTHHCVSELLQFLGVPDAGSLGGASPAYNVFAGPCGPWARFAIQNTTVRGVARRCVPAALRAWIRDTVLRGTKPPMSNEARVFLILPRMRRLESVLGRRLPWRWLNA